ncbi:MAG TPA: hypothetical protein DDY59_00445 [Lachnospiraceae bacterium]|jgi:hypothetical protein|nr:hypothetical protein [Lachnospiraceae bacterium]HCR39380.1 hypothetical protein [Lachnospiraceae bacterium]
MGLTNIVVTVERQAVVKQTEKLCNYLNTANAVSESSTFAEINSARNVLFMAKGLFQVLWNFKLLPNWIEVEEDMNRIEQKHAYILEQKRMEQRRRRRT